MSGQLKGEKIFHGIAVSAGVCRGKILVLHRARHLIARREISGANLESEIKRFEHSLVRTRTQIKEVQRRVTENMSASEGDIFEAHLLMLETATAESLGSFLLLATKVLSITMSSICLWSLESI